MIDILYVSYNRFAMTVESMEALIANTDWDLVRHLYIQDDGSTDDETLPYLHEAHRRVPTETILRSARVNGPVAAMLWYLDMTAEQPLPVFAKVDNDFVVCPGWLEEMLDVLEQYPEVDLLGTEPMAGPPLMPPAGPIRGIREASHMGGKGLLRRRCFDQSRPVPGDYGPGKPFAGFTEWQHTHPEVVKAWIEPDLPCFGLDQLPFEPWQRLAKEYAEAGWARRWPPYHPDSSAYWDWWLMLKEAAA